MALETGVYSRDISTQRLKKLDLNDLSIAETGRLSAPARPRRPGRQKAAPDRGCNPYDNSSTVRGNVGSNPYNSGGKPALKPSVPSPGETPATPRKPMDLKRLQEWMEIRKRVEQNRKQEDDDDE